jgi:hypothetical protein
MASNGFRQNGVISSLPRPGTIRSEEQFPAAVVREAHKETGLQYLKFKAHLSEQIRNSNDVGKDEIQQGRKRNDNLVHFKQDVRQNTRRP